MNNLEQLFERVRGVTEETVARYGNAPTLWHAITATGDAMIVPAPETGDPDLAASLVRALFEIRGVVRYVMVSSAWWVETQDPLSLPPSKHPDRVEVVLFSGEDEAEGFKIIGHRILRERGKAVLGPEMEGLNTSLVGRFAGMLPKGRVH